MVQEQLETEIFQLIDAFNQAFKDKNLDAVLALFDSKLCLSFVGSESFERADNPKELCSVLSTIFSREDSYTWDWKTRAVKSFGRTAWLTADADIVVKGRQVERYPYRITGVFVKRRGKWSIVQFHGSEPASE